MKQNFRTLQAIISIFAIFGLLFGASGSLSVQAAPGGDGDIRTATSPITGMLTYVGASPSEPLGVTGAVGPNMDGPARAAIILSVYAPQFGIANAREDLALVREKQLADGRRVMRYQQMYQGVPVIAGDLVLQMNDGGLISLSGKVSPNLSISTTPSISANDARATAIALVAKLHNVDAAQLTATEPALWIYDARLLEGKTTRPAHLVWRVEVTADGKPVRELVLVNAKRGSVSLNFNQVDTVWSTGARPASSLNGTAGISVASSQPSPQPVLGTPVLKTYSSNGTNGQRVSLVCQNNVRSCGSGNADANDAHAFAYDTYAVYAAAPFNRDSIDGAGMALVSNVNWNQAGYCPNAFWDGDEMTYCNGLAADDVVGHELTHGVTQSESNLFYYWESGAMNESFSDVWGEYVDQTNGDGTDGSSYNWKIGEDATGIGVIRDMKNPPAYGQPDSMTSTQYCKSGSCYSQDNGGVHDNSGVNNKAVYLLVAGGSFNGKTVSSIGWTKTITIYYEANTNLLSSGSGYYDLYYALYQACINTVGVNGITLADCQEVRDATDAVKMNVDPGTNFNPNTTACPVNTAVDTTVFTEDFETGTDGWTFSSVSDWLLWSNTSYYPDFGPYAYDGVDALYADDLYYNNDATATSPSIALPAGEKSYLYFAHDYWLQNGADGGVLEYSVNGGAFTDASALFNSGQNYSMALGNTNGNPIGGRMAFTGDSHGYVNSLYNLSSLAGQNVAFRWRMGTDSGYYVGGWWLDAIQVNTCLGVPSVPALTSPAENALVKDLTPLFDWGDSSPDLDHYVIQVDDNNDFGSLLINDGSMGATSSFTPVSNLPAATTLYWRVIAYNNSGGSQGWSAVRSFRTAYAPPTLLTPANLSTGIALKPTFDWDDAPGATSYTIQVSRKINFSLMVVNKTVGLSTYTHNMNLLRNTIYYWRVRVNGTFGPSDWSPYFQFRTTP